jgi:hypothetical protein
MFLSFVHFPNSRGYHNGTFGFVEQPTLAPFVFGTFVSRASLFASIHFGAHRFHQQFVKRWVLFCERDTDVVCKRDDLNFRELLDVRHVRVWRSKHLAYVHNSR